MGLFDKFKKNEEAEELEAKTIYAPLEGNVISLEHIPDPVFSEGVLGFGCGIEPTSEVVYAPFHGKVVQVSDTKHAVGLCSEDGMELLIHVGMDTVSMNGKGFQTFVEVGKKVKKGDKLLKFSISDIKKAGFSTTTAVVVCNAENSDSVLVAKIGNITVGETLLKL